MAPSAPLRRFTLTPDLLLNLTGGRDFVSPLAAYNGPTSAILLLFEFISPLSLTLNLFVLISCLAILFRKSSDRPALVFIAYNSTLDIFTLVADAIVVTSAVNPSLTGQEALPDEEELQQRCSVEKALVTFTMFSSLGSVLLLTIDRFIFITRPLNYNEIMNLNRALALALTSTVLSTFGAIWYSFSVRLPWDKVCTFTHVLPLGMVLFWNVFFFVTWLAMHLMYVIILAVALRHRRRIRKSTSTSLTLTSSSSQRVSSEGGDESVFVAPTARKTSLSVLSKRIRSMSAANILKEKSQVKTTFKTVRYIVLLLLIYSLVELPCITVAIDDLLHHRTTLYETCTPEETSKFIGLPEEEETSISLLQCMERFVEQTHGSCDFYAVAAELEELPWCQMLSETSHALHLTRVFTMALLGWIANAMFDPIVYAFWYPVFRKNLVKMLFKLKSKVALSSDSMAAPIVQPDHHNERRSSSATNHHPVFVVRRTEAIN